MQPECSAITTLIKSLNREAVNTEHQFINMELSYWQNRYITTEQRAASIGAFSGVLFSMLSAFLIDYDKSVSHTLIGTGMYLTIGMLLISVIASALSIVPFNFGIRPGALFFRERLKKYNSYTQAIRDINDNNLSDEKKNWLLYTLKSQSDFIEEDEMYKVRLRDLMIIKKAVVMRQMLTAVALLSLLMAFITFTTVLLKEV